MMGPLGYIVDGDHAFSQLKVENGEWKVKTIAFFTFNFPNSTGLRVQLM
jgi:hypothetical protein